MRRSFISKVIAVISLLMCFLAVFSSESVAINDFVIDEFYSLYADGLNGNEIDVSGEIKELNIVPMQAILQGEEIQMSVEEISVGTMAGSVEWSSDNSDVISCTKSGKIKGMKKGSATITVKAKNGKAKDFITVYCAKKLNSPISTRISFPLAWSGVKPSFFSMKHFFGIMFFTKFMGIRVTVKGYYDSFFYITYEINDKIHSGYIWNKFLPSNIASDEIFKQLSAYNMVVFSGETSTEKLTTNYEGSVRWRVSDESVVSFDKSTGKITAKRPGTAIISATVGTKTLNCMVFSVSKWYESEVSTSEKDVYVRDIPAPIGKTVATLPKGTNITADGDLENGLGWIHITAGAVSGFIQLSDFPDVDYLMSEYHYYDEGFEVRFDSPISKIYDYAKVLNDVMMDNFNLKICPYVEAYTSTADQCKIWSYGSVYTNNLYATCPQTGNHSNLCLSYAKLRESMLKNKGEGSDVVGKCVWTGHILDPHLTSVSNELLNAIVFTCKNVTTYSSSSNRYNNIDVNEIWQQRITEIVHETAHLFGAKDGYCFGIPPGEEFCENPYCYSCNKKPIPDCIMAKQVIPDDTTDVFCDECRVVIMDHLADHH